MRRPALCLLLLAAANCSLQPLAPGACAHTLQPTPLVELSLLTPPTTITTFATLRIRVGVALRAGCDVLGDFDVAPISPTPGYAILAHVWHGSDGCGPMQTVTRVFSVGVMADVARVYDGAPGGTLSINFDVRPMSFDCSQQAQCAIDCQCGRQQCVFTAAGSGVCRESCSEDVDCVDPDRPHCVVAADPPFTCGAAPADGQCDPACPLGQSCANGVCRPAPSPSSGAGACKCDGDCGAGRLCSSVNHTCIVPCTTNQDCPAGSGGCFFSGCIL